MSCARAGYDRHAAADAAPARQIRLAGRARPGPAAGQARAARRPGHRPLAARPRLPARYGDLLGRAPHAADLGPDRARTRRRPAGHVRAAGLRGQRADPALPGQGAARGVPGRPADRPQPGRRRPGHRPDPATRCRRRPPAPVPAPCGTTTRGCSIYSASRGRPRDPERWRRGSRGSHPLMPPDFSRTPGRQSERIRFQPAPGAGTSVTAAARRRRCCRWAGRCRPRCARRAARPACDR